MHHAARYAMSSVHDAGHRSPRTVAAPRPTPFRSGSTALAAAVVLLALVPHPVRAAEGLYLTWNDCAQGAAAASNRDFACNTNVGVNELYVAFTMPQATDNVRGAEIVIDVQHASAALPDWWRLEPGGCRWPMFQPAALTAAATFPGGSACLDTWQGAQTAPVAEIAGYLLGQPGGAASQVRIKVTVSVLPGDERTLDGTSMYYAARIVLANSGTVGSPSCAGCTEAACLVLNSIIIGRTDGSPGGNFFLQTAGPGEANWALWQGGSGANCSAVPIRKSTWGMVKHLYR